MNVHEVYWKGLLDSGQARVDFETGCVYSCLSGTWKRIGSAQSAGYLHIAAGPSRAIRHPILSHRLVWLAAGNDFPKGYEINHKNGIKTDNRLENLECVTRSANTKHAHDVLGLVFGVWSLHGKQRGENAGRAKLTWAKVRELRELYKGGGVTQARLATMFGVNWRSISLIVRNKTWVESEG